MFVWKKRKFYPIIRILYYFDLSDDHMQININNSVISFCRRTQGHEVDLRLIIPSKGSIGWSKVDNHSEGSIGWSKVDNPSKGLIGWSKVDNPSKGKLVDLRLIIIVKGR